MISASDSRQDEGVRTLFSARSARVTGMNRTNAALYLSAIGVLLALHISAPIVLAFLTGALLADATRGRGP
jgi:hypothetical protein